MLTVDTHIPAPRGRGPVPFVGCLARAPLAPLADLPLEDLRVGDSVLVPPAVASASSVYRTIGRAMKDHRTGPTYTARSEQGGVRVWRTA